MTGSITLEQFERPSPHMGSRDFSTPVSDLPEDSASDADVFEDDIDPLLTAGDEAMMDIVTRFERLLSEIEQRWVADLEQAIAEVAANTGQSISALLPHLLTDFGCSEIAASVVAIVEKADLQAPALMLSLADHDEIVAELADLQATNRIEVRKLANQAPGTAKLHWDQGGADLDVNEFLTLARRSLERDASMTTHGEQ